MMQGVYKITGPNGRCYIGQSAFIEARWLVHLEQLKQKKHHCWKLQAAFNKYGVDAFKFSIIEVVADRRLLKKREASYIRQNWHNCYNVKDEAEHYSEKDFLAMSSMRAYTSIKNNKRLKPHARVYNLKVPGSKPIEPNKHEQSRLVKSYCGTKIKIPNGHYYGRTGTIISVWRQIARVKLEEPNAAVIDLSISSIIPQISC